VELVRIAATLASDLVVVGTHQEERLDERARGRTAICASRYLTVPLLAVSAAFEAPCRCLVAFPDGHEHGPTLRAARALLAPGGRLWVALPDAHAASDDVSEDAFREVECERRVLGPDVLESILRLADEIAADLIVVPNHGTAGAIRAFLPNVTVPLLSDARASVLVVPDAESRP
jgi:nucleotide-binding universal stress UspA family protein